MPRTADEIRAELAEAKASGKHPRSKVCRALQNELEAVEALTAGGGDAAPADGPPAQNLAYSDVSFISEALVQFALKGKAGKVEQGYSDIRSLLRVKHIIEDSAGLAPSCRVKMPTWDSLGRERDTGEFFKPGENQAVVDGLAQRAVPTPPPNKNGKAVKPEAPTRMVITDPLGKPLPLPRMRTIPESEGKAVVTVGVGGPLDSGE